MTFEVKVKQWHAVASWTWNAGEYISFFLQQACSVY